MRNICVILGFLSSMNKLNISNLIPFIINIIAINKKYIYIFKIHA